MRKICAIVLAAGRGTRMNSSASEGLPKVLHPLLGKPMIIYTAKLLENLKIESFFVVGFGAERVKDALKDFKNIQFVEQDEQLGTAHAARLALKKIPAKYQAVLVLHGDSSAFFQPETIKGLINIHFSKKPKLSILTLRKKSSDGSGVLLRNKKGKVIGNVETKNKTYHNCEVNVGAFIYDLKWLKKILPQIKPSGELNNEYYLTDSINIAGKQKAKIQTLELKNSWEKTHINTPTQLKNAQKLAKKYLARSDNLKIAVIGLGYVGLPLAVEFSKADVDVIGFDIDKEKIENLRLAKDPSQEIDTKVLKRTNIEYTYKPEDIGRANFIIVTVPTPITHAKQPNLSLVKRASSLIGQNMRRGSIVVFESTVYPGVTEEICLPILEKESGLNAGRDFKVGYSPERINPGDKTHTIDKIIKVVSGMDKKSLDLIAQVYSLICKAGVFKAESIKVAEAAKVIENTQRDLNIALMNELSFIFNRMGIRTKDVLKTAGTKWNFHPYYPGLVGGHCISVDPYYLAYKAESLDYHCQVILAGRRVNDTMPEYVADLMIKGLIEAGKKVEDSKVLILGLTFKENVADIRNSKIKETIKKLKEYKIKVYGFDPYLTKIQIEKFGIEALGSFPLKLKFNGIILSTLHQQFQKLKLKDLAGLGNEKLVLVDIRSFFNQTQAGEKGIIYKNL